MNIFVVEENPVDAARALCDKHVVKMVLESVQLLSTVAQARGHEGPYKVTGIIRRGAYELQDLEGAPYHVWKHTQS